MQRLDKRTMANRENSRKSTGPKTEEGKARSRANAFVHGLAGQGVAWPCEEQAEVDAFIKSHVELERPQDEREVFLAARAAALGWQILRADRIEAAQACARSARGKSIVMEARDREIEVLVQRIETEPHRAVRSLLRTADGCEWILTALQEFVAATKDDWVRPFQNERLDALCLPPLPGLFRVSRAKVLAEALCHNLEGVWPNGIPVVADLPDDATAAQKDAAHARAREIIRAHRPLWLQELREILLKRIEEVQQLLEQHRAEPDPGLELAHLTAAFDDSPAGERLRRYQRSNLRERRAMLAELDAWRAGKAERESRPEVEFESSSATNTPPVVEPAPPQPTPKPATDASTPDSIADPPEPAPTVAKATANDHTQVSDALELAKEWLRSAGEYEREARNRQAGKPPLI